MLTASWPSGQFGAMGIEGAVRLAARRQLESIEDRDARHALFEELVAAMQNDGKALNAASYMELDAVIDPMESRNWVIRALERTPTPARREGKKRICIDTW